MKKSMRAMLLVSSLLLFIIVAPLAVLYAMGYRLNSPGESGRTVGVVLVNSTPGRADVYANNSYVGRTPEAIVSQTADSLLVRLEREGYVRWEKRLPVAVGLATEVRDIRLFPTTSVKRTLAQQVIAFVVSPNRSLLAVLHADKQLVIIDTDGVLVTQPIPLSSTPTLLLWSPNSGSLLLAEESGATRLLNTSTGNIELLTGIASARDFTWDPKITERLLYINSDNKLIAHRTVTDTQEILAEDITTFATSNRYIYTVNRQSQIQQFTFSGQLVTTNATAADPIAALYVTPTGKVAARTANNSLLLITDTGALLKISDAVTAAAWSPAGSMLYVLSDANTLHIYNVDDEQWQLSLGELQLVQRLSRTIQNVQWFAGGRHLLYQIDDTLHVTEIDTRDHPINYQLDSVNLGDAKAAVGADGETIYYLKREVGVTSLIAAEMLVRE